MVPPIEWVFCHLATDLFECAAADMGLFEKLAVAIIAAF